MKGICDLKMTVPSNTLLISLIWLIWCSVAVNGQQVKPDNVNTCKLYDLTTGAILTTNTFQVNIQETDNRVSKSQSVIIPIHGQIQQFLYPNSADQTTVDNYGLSIFQNPNTGYNELLVTASIDRDGPNPEPKDDLSIISLNFDCTYASGTSTFTQKFEMKILVDDANDNAPVFTNAPYSVNIKEALPISNTVFDNIIATDRDTNKNKEIRFTIASGALYNGLSYFDMPNDDLGYVNLVRALDYEALYANSATNFNLVIHARDNNANSAVQLTTTTTLTVTVEDSDDLPPTFYFPGCFTVSGLGTSCEAAVYRSTLTNGVVAGALTFISTVTGSETATGSIRAFDMDRLNAQIQFSIVGSTPSGFANRFTVSTSSAGTDTNLAGRDIYTATVTQTQVIGRNEVTLLKLFLRASQINDPTKFRTAEIQFTVQANNQNPPQISTNTGSFNGYIYERNTIGETVRATQTSSSPSAFQIIVTDPDVIASDNQSYIYTILEAVPFAVQTSGANIATIYSTQVLDRESQTLYTFTLRVTENVPTGARSSDQQVQVTVLDVNDNDPTFSGNNLQVQKLEGDYTINNNLLTNAFRPLGDVDLNSNPAVTVAIQSVTVRSGSLTQAEVLNRLALRDDGLYLTGPVSAGLVFAVSLRATDNPANTNQNTRTTDTVVLVEVISAGNNAPKFESANYETGISEASPGGTFVIQVVARDAEDATLTYSLVGKNIADKFELASSNS
ncbi:cadherin-99C-like [Dreissena polymorpha]|uniref:cadherin-99C-like n=1 Tax=Dreissena polymorpha TaxID=45954 RepID=UPI002263C611|nr:cadherin-99C-like [Dreissena polymorpha]